MLSSVVERRTTMSRLSPAVLALGLLLTPSWLGCAKQPPPESKQEPARRNSWDDDPFYADMKGPLSSIGDPKLDVSDIRLGWKADDKHVAGFVAYCAANGVTLRYNNQLERTDDYASGFWQVVEPKVQNQSLEVRIRGFPDTASVGQMRLMMWQIQIACGLNAKAHLAMTPPSLDLVERSKLPSEVVRAIEGSAGYKALVEQLQELFVKYKREGG
jgi:hypothetical protein